MKKKKIVFFINAITLTRCIKRIEEFVDTGYEIEAYGFERGGEVFVKPSKFEIKVIGKHDITQSYLSRLGTIYRSMKPIIKQYKNQDVLFYYFFYDVAFAARLISRRPFIYEESDIPYVGIGSSIVRNILGRIDKKMINQSLLTVMTSEGFINYHFGDYRPNNIIVVPNRVNPRLCEYEYHKQKIDINHLKFAFVGGFRYQSVLNFATVIGESFPQHEFHVYGIVVHKPDKEALGRLMNKYIYMRSSLDQGRK